MSIQVQHRRDTTANIEANTPAAGELWFDTSKNEMSMGNGTLAGGIRMAKKGIREILSPAQIVADTNDYSPSGLKHASAVRITTDASRNLTGMVAVTVIDTTDGREITLYNAGSFNLVVQDQNAASSAANRFDLGGADITLAPKQSITLRYCNATSRWEAVAGSYGQAISDGAVSARKLATSSVAIRSGMVNGKIVASNNGTASSFALKTLAGNDPSPSDPVFFVFQDGTGGPVVLSQTAAASWGFSAGSSAGATNGAAFILHHVAINNAGALLFGAVNCRSGNSIMSLGEDNTFSAAAEGGAGAADSAQTIYSSASVSGKYICYLGRSNYESGLATAGTWNANPTTSVLWSPGMARPGEVVSTSHTESGSMVTDGAGNMPGSVDTAPTNSEGTQLITLTTEASKSKANLFEIDYAIPTIYTSTLGYMTIGLFQDSVTNAISATQQLLEAASVSRGFSGHRHRMVSGIASGIQTTFKLRFGLDRAGTTTANGINGIRTLAGLMPSYITARELQG